MCFTQFCFLLLNRTAVAKVTSEGVSVLLCFQTDSSLNSVTVTNTSDLDGALMELLIIRIKTIGESQRGITDTLVRLSLH